MSQKSTAFDTAVPRDYQHFFDGTPAAPRGGDMIERRNPANGQLTARFARGSRPDVDLAVASARRAFDTGPWPWMSGPERAAILRQVAAGIEAATQRLALIDSQESGKTLGTAQADLEGAMAHFRFAASLAETERSDAWTGAATDLTAYSVHEPVGVVALIIPWNFPALILAQKLAYALAAGCTVVAKPSEFTSGSALEIADICRRSGVPGGVVNVVTGFGPDVGMPLVSHPGVDAVSFTGSTVTGRAVAAAAGNGIKRVSLELGGKGANVVFADADLEQAADAAVFAAMVNNGECCVAGSRIIVERSVEKEFVDLLGERLERVVVGDPLDPSTDIGPMIHDGHLRKVLDYIERGRQGGATLACGGNRTAGGGREEGWYVEPTLFSGVQAGSAIFQEEIFGPVVTSTTFNTADEAVALANDTPYGLANAVWTSNVATALTTSRALRSGTVWVNTFLDGTPAIPFGGVRDSGFGRETGQEGLREFTALKTVQIRTGVRDYPIPSR